MQKLIDKLILFGLCLLALLLGQNEWTVVAAMLLAVGITSLNSYFEGSRISAFLCVLYVVLCTWRMEFTVFLPLLVYDCAEQKKWCFRFVWMLPLPFCIANENPLLLAATALVSLAAVLLHQRTRLYLSIRTSFYQMQDANRERAYRLEQKNSELMERQDYEVRLATLAERNRIAREIHDNVGHLLTRSLLQIGAMQVVYGEDKSLGQHLDLIKGTLSDAMDSVRSSVHNLHEEAVDLKAQLHLLLGAFRFCPVRLHYEAAEVLPASIQYCFIAIVREALSNIAKHSDATEASVQVVEHPALYQLIIRDNGSKQNKPDQTGIGLQNMKERVEALNGIFRTSQNGGFTVFLSIPKERKEAFVSQRQGD